MDFGIGEETRALLAKVRDLVDAQLIPLEPELAGSTFAEVQPKLDAVRAQVKAAGLWLPQIEQAHGGMGLDLVTFGLVGAELGRSLIGHYCFNCQAPDSGNMEILLQYANEDLRQRYVQPLLNGDIRSSFSMTEPEFAGSNPVWMGCTAQRDGDDYVINGHKWFTTGGDGAAFTIVMAVTNPEQAPHMRASQILVPMGTPGYTVERNTPCMGHEGDGWMGHAEVRFTDCRVPQANRLGPEGAGFMIAQERLGPGRIHHCMRWIGICERAFELMCQHACARRTAPDTALADSAIVQAWVAESRAEIDAARLMVLRAAWEIAHHGQRAAREHVSAIKFFVANTLQRVLDRAIQTHGGLGITDYMPLAFWWRHERAARIYDGPDEVHKISLARRALKPYREQAAQTEGATPAGIPR